MVSVNCVHKSTWIARDEAAAVQCAMVYDIVHRSLFRRLPGSPTNVIVDAVPTLDNRA